MASGMWFAVVKPDQPVQKKVKYGISITQAVLDTENATEEDSITRVMMSVDDQNLVIANLSLKHGLLQTPLNLHFDQGDYVKLSVPAGSSPVHLFGVTRVDDDELLEAAAMRYQHLLAEGDSDDEDEEEEEEEKSNKRSSGTKRKRKLHSLLDKSFPSDDESDNSYIPTEEDLERDSRSQELSLLQGDEDLDSEDEDDDEDDDEEDDDDDEDDEEQDAEGVEMEDDEVEAGDDSDNDDDDDEEEEDDDEEEEEVLPEPSKKKMRLMNGHAEGGAQPEQKKQKKKEALKVVKEKTPQKGAVKQPSGNSSGTPVQKKDGQPKSAKAQKKFDNKENLELKGTPKQDKKKQQQQKGEKSPVAKPNEGSARKTPKKMLSGGVVAEDITLGNGAVVKNGSTVSVYYEGRLKSNNAVFDKNVSGPPFKFKIGRGEVIRGWDVGVTGMKVGGKRKLIVPPSMGYGKQGAAPSIPPNASLCFDVTVLSAH